MVNDAFALLGLPRCAALSPDEVRTAFQKAAAAAHPDATTDEVERAARTARFQQINEAAMLLTPVAARLNHLLKLEDPGFTVSRAAAMDETMVALFMEVGAAVRAAADWSRDRGAATTFLAKAALTAREMQVQEMLEAAGSALRQSQDALAACLPGTDALRAGGRPVAEILAPLAQRAAFLEKWQAQLQSSWSSLFAAG